MTIYAHPVVIYPTTTHHQYLELNYIYFFRNKASIWLRWQQWRVSPSKWISTMQLSMKAYTHVNCNQYPIASYGCTTDCFVPQLCLRTWRCIMILVPLFSSFHWIPWSAMKRMAASNVLVVGLQGLGAEIGMSTILQVSRTISFSVLSKKHYSCWCEVCHDIRSRACYFARSIITGYWTYRYIFSS